MAWARKALCVAAGLAAGCVASGAALWGAQGRLIFEPVRAAHASAPAAAVEVRIPVQSQRRLPETLDGAWLQGGNGKTVLYLHGNDDDIDLSIGEVTPLRELGYSVLLVDYRGFGRSDGAFPSEATVYEDAEAAWRYLVRERGVRPADLYIYGHSLGGAIAIELARRHPEAAGLVIESSFTSISDMARLQKRYALLPVDLFLNQRFESLRKVSALRLPVLFLHGTEDEVVPYEMGQRLFAASGPAARFVPIAGGRHDHDAAGAAVIRAALQEFVAGRTLTASAR